MNISISPSIIETYRKYYTEEYNNDNVEGDVISDEDVITSAKREVQWNNAMEFGAAFHNVIEFGVEKYLKKDSLYHITKSDKVGEFVLPYSSIQEAVKFREKHPNMIYEISTTYTIKILGHIVKYRMRIDGLEGNLIHENKTTKWFRGVKFYQDSLQGKLYLLATGVKQMQYNVFIWKQLKNKPIEVTPFAPIRLDWNKEILKDVQDWTTRFIEFCQQKDIMEFISEDYLKSKYPKLDLPY